MADETTAGEGTAPPTKRELKAEIAVLSEKLGVDVSTGQLNHAALVELAEQLRAKGAANPPAVPSPQPGGGAVRARPEATPSTPPPSPEKPEAGSDGGDEDGLDDEAEAEAEDEDDDVAGGESAPDDESSLDEDQDEDLDENDEGGPEAEHEDEGERGYEVAPKRSVTSRRGVLGPGVAVAASDFHAGEQRLVELERAGVLVRS